MSHSVVKPNGLREALKAGRPTVGTSVFSASPDIVEIVGHTGAFDYIEFTAEYSTFSLGELDHFARAAELFGLPTMIKVDQEPRTFLAQRGVGSGFQGVLFADCRNPDDVRECVRAVRPDTAGSDGRYGSTSRRFAYWDVWATEGYVRALNDIVVAIMIEKAAILDHLEEALSVPGVDMIQFGPGDYSLSVGKPGGFSDPEVKEAEGLIIETGLRLGVAVRVQVLSAEDTIPYIERGVRHFMVGEDAHFIHEGMRQQGARMKELLPA